MGDYAEGTTEWHLPGMQYMGPGTHVVKRVLNNTKPNNYVDAVALKHDIDYMVAAGDERELTKADNAAISLAPSLSVAGQIMKKGLALRQWFQIQPTYDPRFSREQTTEIGMRLQHQALVTGMYDEYPALRDVVVTSVQNYRNNLI